VAHQLPLQTGGEKSVHQSQAEEVVKQLEVWFVQEQPVLLGGMNYFQWYIHSTETLYQAVSGKELSEASTRHQ
jgi:hypothetical protein